MHCLELSGERNGYKSHNEQAIRPSIAASVVYLKDFFHHSVGARMPVTNPSSTYFNKPLKNHQSIGNQ